MRNILLLVLAFAVMAGCNIINPKEQIPTYIQIDSVAFAGGSHKITSAWVYYNNSPIGVFWLPAKVPVLADKPGTLTIGPGISYDGLTDEQILYPFYLFDTSNLTPAPGQTIRYTPHSKYITAAHFPWKEDFESGSNFKAYDANVTTNIIHVTNDPDKVLDGYGSGFIHLSGSDSISESVANVSVSMPQGQSFLELDYKNEVPFQVGVVAVDPLGGATKVYQAGVNPRSTWNHLYVSLQAVNSQYSAYTLFIIVKASLNGQADGYVYLDNLKVVSY
ncbi:MAG: hypothetical protein JSS82_07900 [Bacteroidetes bacterium]|nr:hypothetical protein [Bacteroidota bacterium]